MFPTNRNLEEDLQDEMWVNQLQKIIIVLLLLSMFFGYCYLKEGARQEIQIYENSITALQDSFKLVQTKKDTFYQLKVVQLTPEEIMKSRYYKTLELEKQKAIEELSKTKNLLASLRFELSGTLSDSTVLYIDSTETLDSLTFIDSTGNLTYKEEIRFKGDTVSRVLQLAINLSPEIKFIKLKNNEIEAQLKLPSSDLEIKINDGLSFYLRETAKEKKKRRLKQTAKRVGIPLATIVSGILGYKAGVKLRKN